MVVDLVLSLVIVIRFSERVQREPEDSNKIKDSGI